MVVEPTATGQDPPYLSSVRSRITTFLVTYSMKHKELVKSKHD